MKYSPVLSACATVLAATAAQASDLNPLNYYLGASVGQASDTYTALDSHVDHDTGWKVVGGLRPLPFLGGEVEYIDFGNTRFFPRGVSSLAPGGSGNATASAGALFALLYLPLPPVLDLFAKVGGERVHTTATGTSGCVPSEPGAPTCLVLANFHISDTESDFAYGAGVQAHLLALALRAEYERTDTSWGHPALLSVGVTYTF